MATFMLRGPGPNRSLMTGETQEHAKALVPDAVYAQRTKASCHLRFCEMFYTSQLGLLGVERSSEGSKQAAVYLH